jgi:hypothetical protein
MVSGFYAAVLAFLSALVSVAGKPLSSLPFPNLLTPKGFSERPPWTAVLYRGEFIEATNLSPMLIPGVLARQRIGAGAHQ